LGCQQFCRRLSVAMGIACLHCSSGALTAAIRRMKAVDYIIRLSMEGPVDEYKVEEARFYLYTVGQFTTAA